ncbi:nucleoprotein TPR-like, partial [Penaeus indicus]|uniref:nucleoprotein TPR-like n=1 Tax=Penaeus indicus TaxID=29960 RepID=UPI00300C04CA
MAAASASEEVFALISEEEKKSISDALARRLEELWETKAREVTALKIDSEKQKITGDQEKFQLERELVAIRTRLEEETRLKDEVKTRSEELEQRLNQSDTEVQNAKARINALSREIQHSHSEQENASTQSAAMAGSLESRNKRIQELQEQVEKLEEQLTVVTRAKCEAVIRAEEAGSRELHLQYKEKRLEQERSLLTRQVDRLQQQLEQRVEESVSQRREHSTTILRLQTDLNHKLEELRVEREENERTQKGLEEKSQRIEELLSALNASRESEMKLDETYRQELVAQKKLADIYQASCQDEKERCTELEKAVEELRKLLQEASEQYGCLERAKKAAEEESAAALQQSNLLVKELKEELDKVNLLMEASSKKDLGGLEDLSPAASAASQLVSRGLSLTQLYSEYMSVSEKLIGTEEENKRLKRYVDQILQEIEDRVPVFKKQRDDHQKSLETITSLHSQLEETLADLEKQRIESQEARRRAKYLERENSRLGMEVKDLGKQVTILVMQVEAARAGQPSPVIPVETDSPTGAGEVISQRLVAFRNVAELQEQNTHLRTSLRELSQQMEAVEKEAVENRTQDLQEELDAAKAQLSELQAARERQESLMENIVNQRNMYRTLLSQQSPQTKPPSSAQSLQSSDVSQEELKKVKEELENSKKELATLKKEHEEYREEKIKNDKLLQDEYENLRANMEKTRNENVKLISQAEYNDERIKTQQNNAEVLQRQIMALEKNNSTLQGIIGRHESTIETLRNELLTLQKKLSCAEVTLENLREERMLLKESEARLLSERESYERSHASQAMVLANLETIKINLEKSDATEKMRYENQIQELTEQCSRLKAKLESNIEVKEATMKLTDAENRIKSMHQEHAAMTKQLLEVKSELSATKTRLAEAQDKMRSAPSPQGNKARGSSPVASSPFRLAGSSPQIRDLQVQLTEERASVATLQASLDQSKRNIDELMGVTKQQEKQLAESNEACKIAQAQLSKLEKEKSEVEEKLTKTESQLSEAVEEAEAVKTLLQTQLAKMQDELQVAQKKLSDANEALTTAKGEEEKAKKEAQQKAQLAGEVQDKYEREVMLHGADLKALAVLKEKQAEYNAELQQVTMAKLKAEEAVRDTRLGFEERENLLRRENKDLLMRSHELEEQNKALLDQFTQLSDKMAALQTKLSVPGADNPNASFTEDEARSSDQLREVIKYLRRERDVSAGKCEVALAEVQRLTAQKKILESQIEQVTKNLAEEREKSQASLDSAGRYGELLRKVHTMDALADSNRLLREEKEGMQNTITEFKAKYESLEKQIEPLQEKQRLSDNKIESLMLEKRSIENEKDLYKKRTQELVEKLNRAKPEDFIRLQQEVVEQQKTLQSKEAEVSRLKNQLAQLSKNQQMIVNQKNQFQQQLNIVRSELHKTTEEFKKLTMEKNRIQAQSGEEFKRVNMEKARLQQQLVATQERVRSLETSSQHAQATHQQEMSKAQEQRNREQQQERQQVMDLKQREDALKNHLEATRKEAESLSEKVKDAEAKLADALKKADNFEKQALQLRKIATKYKKAAEGGSATAATTAGDGSEEPASGGTMVSADKVKEYEETIASLRQKQEKAQEDATKL